MRAARVFVPVVALSLFIASAGCAKKRAQSITDAPAPVEERVAPTESPVPPSPVPSPSQEGWLDGDIDSVNRYAAEHGLIGPVYFDYDRSELSQDARSRLQKNAEFMKLYPQFEFTVEGHCDERGTVEYNLALGQRRAAGVRSYLSNLDVPNSISTVSYGREKPVCRDSTEDCWWRNRRAQFVITARR